VTPLAQDRTSNNGQNRRATFAQSRRACEDRTASTTRPACPDFPPGLLPFGDTPRERTADFLDGAKGRARRNHEAGDGSKHYANHGA
jgi:hypothetical protein